MMRSFKSETVKRCSHTCETPSISGVHHRARTHEHIRNVEMSVAKHRLIKELAQSLSLPRSIMKRNESALIARVHFGAIGEEELDHFHIIVSG